MLKYINQYKKRYLEFFMTLEELKVESYEKKVDADGYYSFATSVGSQEFVYLQTNKKTKDAIEKWENNFSEAYMLKSNNGNVQFVLFSIEGITTFKTDWSKIKDYPLKRLDERYIEIEKLAENGPSYDLENALIKIIS